MRRRCVAVALLLCGSLALPGETIDRIVLVVERHPITELQLEEEVRMTSFLNEEPLSTDLVQRQKAADRLIDQALVQREMQLTRFPWPSDEDIDAALKQLQEEQGGADSLRRTLQSDQLTLSELRAHLALQMATLRFIAFRFRPDYGARENTAEQAYEQEKSEWKAEHPGQPMPRPEASRSLLHRQLLEKETDHAMNEWLEQARKQVRIAYLDKGLGTQSNQGLETQPNKGLETQSK